MTRKRLYVIAVALVLGATCAYIDAQIRPGTTLAIEVRKDP